MDQRTVNKMLGDWRAGREAPLATRTLVAVTLSALVLPGLGQVYNRDFKKGLFLMAAAALSGVSFFVGAGARVLKALPADPLSLDPEQAQAIADQIVGNGGGFLVLSVVVMLGSWVVGIVDAYFGARRRSPRLLEPR